MSSAFVAVLLIHLHFPEVENLKAKRSELAPVKAAVLPLIAKDSAIVEKARGLYEELRGSHVVEYDEGGAIGRRYRRQDEIGTPYCLTVDYDTLEDDAVTIRERDSMSQERVGLSQVSGWFAERLLGC